jgi:LysM repeat protein
MPEPRIRRVHRRSAHPGRATQEGAPPVPPSPPDEGPLPAEEAVPEGLATEGLATEELPATDETVAEEHAAEGILAEEAVAEAAVAEEAVAEEAVPAAAGEPDQRLAPDEAESAEAEAVVLAAGDVASDGESELAVAEAAALASVEAEPAEEAPGEGEPAEAPGWFREASLEGAPHVEEVEGVDLDGWPTAAAAAAATEAEAEGPVVRERDRPTVTPLPAGEPPRRTSRLRRFLVGVATIVAVAAVGFVAGMMLPVIFPGPGIETGNELPSPSASSAASPTPTAAPTISPTPTAAPTISPTPTAAPTPAPTPLIHVVQPGEQLGRIAARYGVTVAAIVAANDLANPNLIRVGQRLIIPLPSPSPAP